MSRQNATPPCWLKTFANTKSVSHTHESSPSPQWEFYVGIKKTKMSLRRVSDHDLISKPRSPQRVKASTHVTVSREHRQQRALEEASAVFGCK